MQEKIYLPKTYPLKVRRKSRAVSQVVSEVMMVALVVVLSAILAGLLYISINPAPQTFISCEYDPSTKTFTVISSPGNRIKWEDCIITLYNESNGTSITIPKTGGLISGGDTIDVSKWVSPGNRYILTISSRSSSTILYRHSWEQ